MNKFFLFSVLRQMRRPIITIIIYYAIAVMGFVLIPGVDNDGNPTHTGFFHALYVIVYTSTTIGFGELPYEWTDNQRLWILISAIVGVVLWVYSMGKIISLSQNKVFKDRIEQYHFENKVDNIKRPFYVLVGYGVTGKIILKHFQKHDLDVVIVDKEESVFDEFDSVDYKKHIPHIAANGKNIDVLRIAGATNKLCKGVIIVSGSEEDNIRMAISMKLLAPEKEILVRAENNDNINNLVSFGTDHIISANKIFSQDLFMLLNHKDEYNLKQKLSSEVKEFNYTKEIPKGKWVICGYNDLTKKVIQYLISNEIDYKLISREDIKSKIIQTQQIVGSGVSKNDLSAAGIEEASVIFAAGSDDFKNLSTIITAKNINPDIYSISTQNKFYRKELFDSAKIDLIFQPQYCVATKIHSLISEPYLNVFYNEIKKMDFNFIKKLELNINQDFLETWHFRINEEKVVFEDVQKGQVLLSDVIPKGHNIKPLMLIEKGNIIIEPALSKELKENDVILFTGQKESFGRQQLLMYNKNIYQEYQFRKNKGIYNG